MVFGLLIITRLFGILGSFFENDKMGFMTEIVNIEVIVEPPEKLIKDSLRNKVKY